MRKEYIGILKMNPLFWEMNDADIEAMLGCLCARERVYEKNSYIWEAEGSVAEVGIVLSGSVHIIKEDYWGNRAIFAQAKACEMFGEAFSCAGTGRLPVSVVAAEKTSILFLDYKRIVTTCSNTCAFHAALISNMLKILAEKNILLTQKIDHLVKRTTREKLLSYLSEQAVNAGKESFTIPFDRQELADYLAVDRSAMSKELSKLREEGVIEFQKNRFRFRQ